MQINNNTDLKKTRDIFQKIVDILDEGIELEPINKNILIYEMPEE